MNKINIPLSGNDIILKLNNKVNVYSYSQIFNFKNINELLGKYKKIVLLYETSKNYGHWCCIYEHKNKIYFFDSYGLKPDEQFNFIQPELKKELYDNHKYLLELLYNSQKEIHYNQYQLQKKLPDIQTCGRWCVLRLKYPSISVNNFYNIFKDTSKLISNDELVSILI